MTQAIIPSRAMWLPVTAAPLTGTLLTSPPHQVNVGFIVARLRFVAGDVTDMIDPTTCNPSTWMTWNKHRAGGSASAVDAGYILPLDTGVLGIPQVGITAGCGSQG